MKAWNFFLAHGDKLLALATTVVTGLAAAGVVSNPISAAVLAGLTFVHNTFLPEPKATSTAASSGSKAQSHWVVGALTAVLALALLSGCASISSFFGSPNGQAVVVAAVDVAVATAEQKGVSATQINSIAKQALAADTGVTATVAAVSQVVNTQLAKLNLPAGDMAAAEVLETALAAAIAAKLGDNASVAQGQAAIAVVLQQVITDTGG